MAEWVDLLNADNTGQLLLDDGRSGGDKLPVAPGVFTYSIESWKTLALDFFLDMADLASYVELYGLRVTGHLGGTDKLESYGNVESDFQNYAASGVDGVFTVDLILPDGDPPIIPTSSFILLKLRTWYGINGGLPDPTLTAEISQFEILTPTPPTPEVPNFWTQRNLTREVPL